MFYAFNMLILIVPVVVLQYAMAIFCLLKLLYLNLPKTKFWIWNFIILLIPVIGFSLFLIARYCFFKKFFSDAILELPPSDNADGKNEIE